MQENRIGISVCYAGIAEHHTIAIRIESHTESLCVNMSHVLVTQIYILGSSGVGPVEFQIGNIVSAVWIDVVPTGIITGGGGGIYHVMGAESCQTQVVARTYDIEI